MYIYVSPIRLWVINSYCYFRLTKEEKKQQKEDEKKEKEKKRLEKEREKERKKRDEARSKNKLKCLKQYKVRASHWNNQWSFVYCKLWTLYVLID